DRAEVVLKVEPYVAMDLVHSDEMVVVVGKLVSSIIFYGRCVAFEEVADMKEPFDSRREKDWTIFNPLQKSTKIPSGNFSACLLFDVVRAAIFDTTMLFIDLFAMTSINTSLVRCSKVMEATLLITSAILFWFLQICSTE
nr:hypothetical protein [Tanacetum cinerariifolium]